MSTTKVVDKTRDRVRKFLQQSFAGVFREAQGAFWGTEGSTMVMVKIAPWSALEDAQVIVVAGIASDVEVTADCMRFLLTENDKFVLGAFALEGDRFIVFRHTILGSQLDKNELEASVRAVAATANAYDDIVTSRWGGVKVRDMASHAPQPSAPDSGEWV